MKCWIMQKPKHTLSKETEKELTRDIANFMYDSLINGIEPARERLRQKTEALKNENDDLHQ